MKTSCATGDLRLGLAHRRGELHMPKCMSLQWYLINFVVCFLAIVASYSVTSKVNDSWCHNTSINTKLYLATKTPYRFVASKGSWPTTSFHFSGCEASQIWILVRHGTRNPGYKMIRKMRERLPQLRDDILHTHRLGDGQLCKETISYLEGWLPHVEEADEKMLTHEGEDEMIELAERYQNRFPGLFPEVYTNSSFKFRYTATQRTRESARYFTIGLFGRRVSRYVWFPEALHKDPILRFYKLCHRWKTEVDKNPESLFEKTKFMDSVLVKKSIEDITKRLGFKTPINADDLHLMYMTCAFETAWEKKSVSPWCAVFSDTDLKVMEYAQDLEYYWVDGYGYDLTYKQACPAIRDMVMHFKSEEEEPRVIAYFTHSGTLLKVLAHLGLYRDPHTLRHDNYHVTMDDRQWRVGRLDSFGTNLAFVLYRCGGEKKVLTLHQEQPVTLPGCPDGDLCPLDLLTKSYSESIDKCLFHEMCALPAPAA